MVVRIGKVEIRRKQREKWDPLEVGDKVAEEDAVRTSDDGSMELSVDEVRVRIRERSEVRVKKISRNRLRAQARGHLESSFEVGKGEVEIEADGSDAVVRSQGGHFSMTADGHGVVAVATVSGVVNLSAAGQDVSVSQGQVSYVKPGRKPERPRQSLRAVLLNVKWPDRRETNQRAVPIAGKVEVGSRVVVQGRPVDPDANGNFKLRVPLRQGKQRLAVTVTDPLGRDAKDGIDILMDDKIDFRKENRLWQ